MIFVKVDVELPGHERVVDIPSGARRAAALGVYLVALCYTRQRELDGRVPVGALEAVATPEAIADLLACGLFREASGGYQIHNYAAKNETKKDIAARRKSTTERVTRYRNERNATVTRYKEVTNAVVPGSGSDSVSDQGEGAGGGVGDTPSSETGAWRRDPMGACTLAGVWCDGVRAGSGQRVTTPTRAEIERIIAAVDAHAPESAKVGSAQVERCEWVERAAREWSSAKPARVSVYAWVDWLNSGNYRPRAPIAEDTQAPKSVTRDLTPEEQAERKLVAEHIARDLPDLLATLSASATPALLRSVDAANTKGADVHWTPKSRDGAA